jgi:hypothetical protein
MHSRSSSTPRSAHYAPRSARQRIHQDRNSPTTTKRPANAHGGNKNITIFIIFTAHLLNKTEDRRLAPRTTHKKQERQPADLPGRSSAATPTTSYQGLNLPKGPMKSEIGRPTDGDRPSTKQPGKSARQQTTNVKRNSSSSAAKAKRPRLMPSKTFFRPRPRPHRLRRALLRSN